MRQGQDRQAFLLTSCLVGSSARHACLPHFATMDRHERHFHFHTMWRSVWLPPDTTTCLPPPFSFYTFPATYLTYFYKLPSPLDFPPFILLTFNAARIFMPLPACFRAFFLLRHHLARAWRGSGGIVINDRCCVP